MNTAISTLKRVDLGEVPYERATADMPRWVDERREGLVTDRLFLLSHPAVVTYGRGTTAEELPASTAGIPTVFADRGGYATYHGPGQLVGYLIVNVRERQAVEPGFTLVRWVETSLIDALGSLGFTAIRRDTPTGTSSLVGVWTPGHRKLASIGMRIRSGVTSHGFALNIDPDLSVFRSFTACRLDDVHMTSLREIADAQGLPTPKETEVLDAVAAAFGAT